MPKGSQSAEINNCLLYLGFYGQPCKRLSPPPKASSHTTHFGLSVRLFPKAAAQQAKACAP